MKKPSQQKNFSRVALGGSADQDWTRSTGSVMKSLMANQIANASFAWVSIGYAVGHTFGLGRILGS
jgi:hypothetical protein